MISSLCSLELQLLRISDKVENISCLIDALDMATTDILDIRQRNAMATACEVLLGRMEDLKGMIEVARGKPA